MNLTTGLMIAQLLLNIVIAVAGWIALRRKATAEEIGKLRASLEEMSKTQNETSKSQAVSCGNHISRTTSLEVQLKNAPTHNDLGEIHERINTVKSSVDHMSGVLQAFVPQLKMVIDHHMQGGSK